MKWFGISLLTLLALVSARAEKPYFQQHLDYRISVELDTANASLTGDETLFYHNNSPDTLHEIYFHLYYNAFQPGSYADKNFRDQDDYEIADLSKSAQGSILIKLVNNDGIRIDSFQVDNTIMRVPLIKPLLPGDSTCFYIEFVSLIPEDGSRTAHTKNRFDIAQWYPKPAVYDRRGWHINQYLVLGEFYGDFGNFDIEIMAPRNYILAHTGTLLNEREIFGDLLPTPSDTSVIVDVLQKMSRDSSTANITKPAKKTWKISAHNVHDFAWSACPDYKIDICKSGNTIIKAYYTEDNIKHWQYHAAVYTCQAIELFSQKYYQYPYGEFSTVQSLTAGGMEYPQFVYISREEGVSDKFCNDLESVIAHEVAHNWFYGILVFNETEEAFLDEGLTTVAEVLYMERYYGTQNNRNTYKHNWQKRLFPNSDGRNDSYFTYFEKALSGREDPVATPSYLFRDSWGYFNASYEKPASIYFMLRYLMGDSKYDEFIERLFERWAYKHLYFSDFKNLAEEIYGADLGWFWHQWFYTDWKLDFSLDGFLSKRSDTDNGKYSANITIGRKGQAISPLDIAVSLDNGKCDSAFIPVGVWRDNQSSFDTTLYYNSKPSRAVINPGLELADINRLNNSSGLPKTQMQYLAPRFLYPSIKPLHKIDSYTISHNPIVWYNSVDGVEAGYRTYGSYLGILHQLRLSSEIGLKSGNIDYEASYQNPFISFSPQVSYYLKSKERDGRGRQEVGLHYEPYNSEGPQPTTADISLKRTYLFDPDYLLIENWSKGNINTLELSMAQIFTQRYTRVYLQGSMSLSTPESDYNFSRLAASLATDFYGTGIGTTRLAIKFGQASGDVPSQRMFYLSEADPYDTWDSPLFSSRGTLPDKARKKGHLFKPGGAELQGYLGRGISGRRMSMARLSNIFPQLRLPDNIPVICNQLNQINIATYFTGARVWDNALAPTPDDMLFEAGVEFSWPIPYLDRFITEYRLHLILPLWISDPLAGESNLKWRWLLSISG